MVGWQRKQYDKGGKPRKILKGERDWTREQKEQIKNYQEKYEKDTNERRKAS